MLPIDFEGSNLSLHKPESMTDEQCMSIRALRSVFPKQNPEDPNEPIIPFILTCWQPSKEDIEAINRGEPIWLRTLGMGFAPTELFTTNEKGEIN